MIPCRQIRATYSESSITVYQAYEPAIGVSAAEHGTFPSSFKRNRMTWVKPSFLWMMHRSGWATKPQQECVLAIQLSRDGFEWALRNAVSSKVDRATYTNKEEWRLALRRQPVRFQWDPERDILGRSLPYRTLQIGLTGEALDRYINEWIIAIVDITETVRSIHNLVRIGNIQQAYKKLPVETVYSIPNDIASIIGTDIGSC